MNKITDIESSICYIVEKYIEEQGVPGIGVGIVKNKELIYTKGFGVKSIATGEPVTSTSLFHMASVSKTFVATAIMQLVEKGLMDIHKPVTEYLPYFKLKSGSYMDITVQHMLSHISGMPDVDDYEWDNPVYDDEALERNTRSISELELMWKPGDRFAYSNIAYEVLGDAIAKVSGMPFETYIRENILNPLGMYESSFLNKELSRELLTTPHIQGNNFDTKISDVFPYNRMHAPSSTLCSNPVEMCNYALTYINKGSFNGKEIIKPSSYEIMTKPYTKAWGDYQVGLSWFIEKYDGVLTISHSGGDTGFGSNLIIQPERGLGVVTMCNCDYGNMSDLSKAILDLLNGHDIKPLKVTIDRRIGKIMLDKGIEAARKEYRDLKENHMDKYNITENSLNSLGYNLMGTGRLKEAIEILKLAIDEFPNSSNLYDSIGEFYLKKGEIELARLNYTKAVELDPGNTHAIEVLRKSFDK